MPSYNIDAINACMRKAQDNTSRFGEVADTFPLNSMLNDEFAAAETRLDGVARALDAVVQTVSDTDYAHADAMTPR